MRGFSAKLHKGALKVTEIPYFAPAVTAGCLICAYLFLFPVYNTSDDVTIGLLLQGRMVPGGTPTPEVYFINLYLAEVLVWLNRCWPAVPWYDVLETGTLAGCTLLALRLAQIYTAGNARILASAFLAAGMLAVLAQPQFTSTAALATGLGAFTLGAAVVESSKDGPHRLTSWIVCGAAVLLFLGTLFRAEAALLALVFAGGCVGLSVWARRRGGALHVRLGSPAMFALVAAIAACIALWVMNAMAYASSPAWISFAKFNALRAWLTEYDGVWRADTPLPGLSRDDHLALSNWVYFDSSVFTLNMLKRAAAGSRAGWLGGLDVWRLGKSFAHCIVFLVPGWLAVAGLVLGGKRDASRHYALLSGAFLCTLLLAVALLSKSPPWRIAWPLALLEFVATATLWVDEPAGPRSRRFGQLLLLAASAVVIAGAVQVAVQNQRLTGALNADVAESGLARMPELIHVGSGVHFDLLERPFRHGRIQRELKVIALGTMTNSPHVAADIARLHPQGLAQVICGSHEDPIVTNAPVIDSLQRYYWNHRLSRVWFKKVFAGQVVDVYRCMRT